MAFEQFTITILQLSDIHSGVGQQSPDRKEPDECCRSLLDEFRAAYERIRADVSLDLLVVNGDFVNRGQADDFNAVTGSLVRPLMKYLGVSKTKTYVVPGNHDVNGLDLTNVHGLQAFRDVLGPHVRVPSLPGDPLKSPAFAIAKRSALIWPVCTVPLAQTEHPDLQKIVDPAYVLPRDRDACQRALVGRAEALRIAVLHHNLLPQSGEGGEGAHPAEFGFMNAGETIDFLLNHRFRIVLHGHQHIFRTAFFARPEVSAEEPIAYVNHGLLSIGTPAFGCGGAGKGFNLLRIDVHDGHRSAVVKVSSFSAPSGEILQECSYPISLIDDPFEKDDRRILGHVRKAVLTGIHRDDPHRLVHEIHNLLLGDELSHFKAMEHSRSQCIDIRAIYTLSVFPPVAWTTKDVDHIFLEQATENIRLGAGRGREEAQLGRPMQFRFSTAVFEALNRSCEHASQFEIAEGMEQEWRKGEPEFLGAVGLAGNTLLRAKFGNSANGERYDLSNSMSVWDNMVRGEKTGDERILSGASIFRRSTDTDLHYNYEDDSRRKATQEAFEFPRILLWEAEALREPDAIKCILFHEKVCFPLFWIAPEALPGRKLLGHTTILALEDERGKQRREAVEVWNDADGRMVQGAQVQELGGGAENRFLQYAWNGKPPDELQVTAHAIEEFLYLLKRPEIMLAADAWAMVMLGRIGELPSEAGRSRGHAATG